MDSTPNDLINDLTQAMKFQADQPALASGQKQSESNLDFPLRQIKPKCPVCKDAGFVRHDVSPGHPQFGKIVHCDTCALPQREIWLKNNSGLDAPELVHKLDDFQPGTWGNNSDAQIKRQQRIKAIKAMRTALSDKTGFYTFHGDFGSGKSLALKILCNELRRQLFEVYYTDFVGILDHLRSMYSAKQDTSIFWRRLMDIPVLAIDEVSRFDDNKGFARERLFSLVSTRYRRIDTHLTIFATNDNPTIELPPSEDIGYLFSRMREGDLIKLTGDWR